MVDGAGFSMHQSVGSNHLAAKCLSDRLMAQTDAQDRRSPRRTGHVLYQRNQNSGIMGRARARRQHNPLRVQGFDLFRRQLVVAANHNLRAQFAQVLHEVVSERIVVVEDENHAELQGVARNTD